VEVCSSRRLLDVPGPIPTAVLSAVGAIRAGDDVVEDKAGSLIANDDLEPSSLLGAGGGPIN